MRENLGNFSHISENHKSISGLILFHRSSTFAPKGNAITLAHDCPKPPSRQLGLDDTSSSML